MAARAAPTLPPRHAAAVQAAYANINDGYVEALVRGYRGGLLTAGDYNNLSQCENLDDVKMHLVRRRRAGRAGPLARTIAPGSGDRSSCCCR